MKPRTHDCPYLQGKKTCVNKHMGDTCVFSNPDSCLQYVEWVEGSNHHLIKESIITEAL
jgi:hypothetical protein